MERKRSIYLNIGAFVVFFGALFFLNAAVLNQAIPDRLYRLLGLAVDSRPADMSKLAADEALERENAALRKQLSFRERTPRTLSLAKIIAIQRTALASNIIINQGKAEGVREGMAVLVVGNVIAGNIHEVFEHSSRVMLADDPRFVASVRILDTSILAEAKGNLRDSIELNFIGHNDSITSGQTIVTSGLDAFPVGLAIGTISSVELGTSTLFQDVSGTTLFDFHESPYVFIIIQP